MKLSDLGPVELLEYFGHLQDCAKVLEDVHNQLEVTGLVNEYTVARIKMLVKRQEQPAPIYAEDHFCWRSDPPTQDGDFYYSGPLPGSGEEYVGIVSISMHPLNRERYVAAFFPPGWRGDTNRISPEVVFGKLEEWKGQWAGPELGLSTVVL